MKSDIKIPKKEENTCDLEDEDIFEEFNEEEWRMNEITEKPCHLLRYCPYSDEIINQFPVPKHFDKLLCDQRSSDLYKHHCPVFYLAQCQEDLDFAGIAIAENLLESIGHEVERTEQLPPRTEEMI